MDKNIDFDNLLSLCLDIGEIILKSGGEVNRTETTIIKICQAYNIKKINVFSFTSIISVCITTSDNKTLTQIRRIYDVGTNLKMLETANSLSRYICKNKPNIDEIEFKINDLIHESIKTPLKQCIGNMLISGSFSMYFGANFLDAFVSAAASLVIFYITVYTRISYINRIVYTIICSAMSGIFAVILTKLGIGESIDKIIIGNIMLLIPGMATINSIRDMLLGDIIAGTIRLIEALLTALSIGLSFAAVIFISGGTLK